jgi:hypothetical protein
LHPSATETLPKVFCTFYYDKKYYIRSYWLMNYIRKKLLMEQ